MKIYSIFDKKAVVYSPLMTFENDTYAMREFEHIASSGLVSRYPSDFALYCVGEFDDKVGLLTSFEVPKFVIEAVSFQQRGERVCSDAQTAE